MSVETLGEALQAGWRVRARCAFGKRDGLKSIRECNRTVELDLGSLAWTRGRNFPLARLGDRMMCPDCGSRKVTVTFEPPAGGGAQPAPVVPSPVDRHLDLPATVDHVGSTGSLRRRLAAAVRGDIARGAFEAAIEIVKLEEGESIALREGARLLAEHPPRRRAVDDPAVVNAEFDALREGLPRGRRRVWK